MAASSSGVKQFHTCEDLEFHVIPSREGRDGTSLGIPLKSLSFLQQSGTSILSSSHGLLLLKRGQTFLICNPATASYTQLPLPDFPPMKAKAFTMHFLLLECHPRNVDETPHSHFPSDYTIIAPVYWEEDVEVDELGAALADEYEDEHPWFSSTFDFAVYQNGKWEDMYAVLGWWGGKNLQGAIHCGL